MVKFLLICHVANAFRFWPHQCHALNERMRVRLGIFKLKKKIADLGDKSPQAMTLNVRIALRRIVPLVKQVTMN